MMTLAPLLQSSLVSSMPTAVSAAVTRTVRPSTLHLLRVRKQINILNLNLFEFIFCLWETACLEGQARPWVRQRMRKNTKRRTQTTPIT